MKKTLLPLLALMIAYSSMAQEHSPRWLRYPAISPDGQTIVFGYMGNLYKVSSNGGLATALTVGSAYNERPVWSPDGKTIAFSNNLHGNFDVYTMPAYGGTATRITFHSADDVPYDFTPDSKNVLVGSYRVSTAESIRFPSTRYFQNTYTIPVNGGRPILLTAAGMENARYNKDGTKIAFHDKKGYEDYYRKHQISSIARDVWVWDIQKDNYTKITTFRGEDREPHFNNDGNSLFYTSEADGSFNIYKWDLKNNESVQLTQFKNFPVRDLTISKQDKMAFQWDGDIYTFSEGQQAKKVTIQIHNNAGYNAIVNKKIRDISEFSLSPNGKEIAFVSRGEVFVTSVEGKLTKRITNTPEQERMITWAPDGKALLFASERDNSWNIYSVSLDNPKETFFFASTTLKTETLIASQAEEFQPKYSPDGKKIAFIENRNILKVLDIKSKKTVTILPEGHNYSYSDGDWDYQWSPDSKWLLVDDSKGYFGLTNTALIAADGNGKISYPVNSGFGEGNPKWGMEGKLMTYTSSKWGRRSLAYQGSREDDIYAIFFDEEAYDDYILSKEEFNLLKEKTELEKKELEKDKKDKKDKKEENEDKKEKKKKDKKDDIKPLKLNLQNLENRKVKLTISSASTSDYVLSKDGEKLYYLAEFEKGYDLWVTEPRTKETKILAKMGGTPSGIALSEDEKTIYLSNKGQLSKVNAETGKIEGIAVDMDFEWNPAAEREFIFYHTWRQTKEKFYDPKLHNVDWDMYRDAYSKFLPHINNNYDFSVLLSELLGELNASHTGGRFFAQQANADQTASLGILFDEKYQGDGIKISDIILGSPADKFKNKVQPGDILTSINGKKIGAHENWNTYLLNIIGKNTLLTINRGGKTITETIKPVSLATQETLMYERWIKKMEHLTDSLSKGRIGYVHVQGMNDNSFREVYDKVKGDNINKEALIVDTRFNGGGWLHNDLNTFLSGKEYLKFAPQGNLTKGGEPIDRWEKPSIVVMSEGNYSDAFIFPFVYKQNKLGKLVGMPVAGTGTAVWWERQIDPTIVFGIPMVATIGNDGKPTENVEVMPDIEVNLSYEQFLKGEDSQIETAVKELLKTLK
ncbi:MAG TPA: S41 family peptidase [Edaphocola sp.]|nr:S41 family peptidase [Edaphocola sp.]